MRIGRGINLFPYDGGGAGSFEGDTVGIPSGRFNTFTLTDGTRTFIYGEDPFSIEGYTVAGASSPRIQSTSGSFYYTVLKFNVRNSGPYTAPASVAVSVVISY